MPVPHLESAVQLFQDRYVPSIYILTEMDLVAAEHECGPVEKQYGHFFPEMNGFYLSGFY